MSSDVICWSLTFRCQKLNKTTYLQLCMIAHEMPFLICDIIMLVPATAHAHRLQVFSFDYSHTNSQERCSSCLRTTYLSFLIRDTNFSKLCTLEVLIKLGLNMLPFTTLLEDLN